MKASSCPSLISFAAPAVILGGWALLLLKLFYSPVLSVIQNPHFHPLTWATGCLLLAAAFGYPFLYRPSLSASLNWFRLLAICSIWSSPVVVYLVFPASTFSTDQLFRLAQRQNSLSVPSQSVEINQSASVQETGNATELSIYDLLDAQTSAELQKKFNGTLVSITGQFHSLSPTQFELARILIFCCAADAKNVAVSVRGKPPVAENGDWFKVKGVIGFRGINQPIELEAREITATAPENVNINPNPSWKTDQSPSY